MIQVVKIIFNQSRIGSQLYLKKDSTLVRHEKYLYNDKTRNS